MKSRSKVKKALTQNLMDKIQNIIEECDEAAGNCTIQTKSKQTKEVA